MVEVLRRKELPKKEIECLCGCLLGYINLPHWEKGDVEYLSEEFFSGPMYYIDCPECERRITVDTPEGVY